MNQGKTSLRQKLVRSLFGNGGKTSRRRRKDPRFRRRFESLESRLMLHGGVDHSHDSTDELLESATGGEAEHASVNGPHAADPTYNLSQFHIHAQLDIYVNGTKVEIPTFGGVQPGDSIHTHDGTGTIHMHPIAARTTYIKLSEVFQAWRTAPSGGNANANLTHTSLMGNTVDGTETLHMFVNGTRTEAYENYQIHDGDSIVLNLTTNPIVTLNTTIGPIQMELFRDKTPITVNNFLNYVNGGDYNNSFFHRYIPGFVLQGGGFKSSTNSFANPTTANQFTSVTTDPEIQNEFNNYAKATGTTASVTTGNQVINLGSNVDLSTIVVGDRIRLNGRTDGISQSNMFDITAVNDTNNTVTVQQAPTAASATNLAWAIFPKVNLTGTIAMAKLGGDPNSATSQFFINLGNNDSNLDLQNGGFTVFGRILDTSLLTDVSQLNSLSLFSANLTGGSEVPPVTTTANGSAIFALNKATNQFDLNLNVQGLTQNNITNSHIHVGAIGQEGDPIFDLGAGSQYTTSGNNLVRTIDNGAFPSNRVTDLQQNRTYVNVHTSANPDGEIRGQLTSFQSGLYTDLATTSTNQLVTIQSVSGEGEIRGTVFHDADHDGVKDASETGRQNVTVYADANNNSRFDSGEVSTTTNTTGAYTLRLAGGQHKIRMVPATGVSQTMPADQYDVTVLIGGQTTGRDFGVFDTQALTGLDLIEVSDTGASNSDNVTNLNNSAAGKTLQFRVNGAVEGALVRILADGNVIGQGTVPSGNNGTFTVTTNASTTLADGARSITATQTLGSATSAASTALVVTVDSTLADFTSTAPTTATVGTALSYNAQHAEEAQTGFVYSLSNAPTGVTIDANTGVVSWTPTATQTGTQSFGVVVTDLAGNTRTQPVSLAVTKTPQIRYDLVVTDMNGNPVTQVNIGSQFQLRASVTDVRQNVPSGQPRGVFAAYHDVTFNGNLATASGITHSPDFGNSPSGTFTAGLLDEVGSFRSNITPSGTGTFLIYTATFTATRSGTVTFTGDAPDAGTAHNAGVYGNDNAVPLDEINYGLTSVLIVNPDFNAENDTFNFNEDTSNNTLNVLTNDEGRPGTTLTILSLGTTDKGGTVTIATGGQSVRYTPAANFFGEEKFTYTVSDGSDEAVATVTVQVHPVNDAPTAVNDTFTVAEDAQAVSLAVLQNDKTDPDGPGESLKVKTVTQPANGTLTIENNGLVVRYTPRANFIGTDTFTYTIEDSGQPAMTGNTATATVTVTSVNDPPTAVTDTVTASEDSQNNVYNVLANDSFAPDTGETLTITAVSAGSRNGVVTIVENGTRVNYTPAANVFGTETFTYTISDGNQGTATATVTVTLSGVNDAPDAVNDSVTVAKNSQNNTLQVLTNDLIAPDADETLTIASVTQGNQGGTVTIVENGTRIRYVPANNYLGTETFTYTIRDRETGGLTDTATVTVSVQDYIPSSLAGFVYLDSDNDGVKDTGETGMSAVQITLTGTDTFGQTVNLTATTDANGAYSFTNLAPGNYKVKETQPTIQVGGLPVTDGKDTVGSAGGTASANDEFTITLAQNVTATNYNFGETTGFRIIGKLTGAGDNGQAANGINLNGVQVQLFSANGQNQPTGTPVKTATLKADGSFTFDGVSPGSYVVSATAPTFLQLMNANQPVTITNADSVNAVVLQAARQAKFISYRDFMNSTPRQGIFAAVDLNTKTQVWSGLDSQWTGFTEASIQPTSDNTRLRMELTQTNGQKMFDEIPLTDSRIHTIATDGNAKLYRLQGGSSNYNLRPVTTSSAAGEGEAEGESSAEAATMAAPGVLDSSANGLGENNGVASADDLQFVLDVDAGSTSGAEGESSNDLAHAVDAVMSELDDSPWANDSLVDDVAEDHNDESGSHDHTEHGSAVDQSLVDLLEAVV